MVQRRRQLSELNLIDNFLFIMLLEHDVYGPRTAEIILSIIIGRDVHVSKVHVEKILPSEGTDFHGVRLDAYVEEEHADVEYVVAHGIATMLNGERTLIGSAHFLFDDEDIKPDAKTKRFIKTTV